MTTLSYIAGGKLGDFLHMMWVPYRRWKETNCKSNVFITNDPLFGGDRFHYDLQRTFQDLAPIMRQQPYIARFEILTLANFDENHVNLNAWRGFITSHWIRNLSNVYAIPIPRQIDDWMRFERRSDESLKDCVAIHRSVQKFRWNPNFPWQHIVENNKCIFITDSIEEYNAFPWKDKVTYMHVPTLVDRMNVIANCRFYVGNMSSPLASAVAIGKPCLAELNAVEGAMYKDANFCNGKCFWFQDKDDHYMDGIQEWLKLPPREGTVTLEVSIGEALDKLTILQIKQKHIKDKQKLVDIETEIAAIQPKLQPHLQKVVQQYQLLMEVNQRIWDLCDVAREKGATDPIVMRENDARFRVKKKINILCGSRLREQKSFGEITREVDCGNTEEENWTPEKIRKISVYYDELRLVNAPPAWKRVLQDDPWIRFMP